MVAAIGIVWAGGAAAAAPAAAASSSAGAWRCRSSAPRSMAALAWAMMQSAREHRSIALEGDARHLITDVWTSAGVVLGVGLRRAHRLAVAGPGSRHRRRAEHPARRRGADVEVLAGLDGRGRWSPRCCDADRSHAGRVQAPDDPLRPHLQPPLGPAPLRRPAHAHARQLDAGPRRRRARRRSSRP